MVQVLVRLPTKYELEEIGDLDFTTTIPAPKSAKCAFCGDPITGSAIIGVKKGNPLFFFHQRGCLDQGWLFDNKQADDDVILSAYLTGGYRRCHCCGMPRDIVSPGGGFNRNHAWVCMGCRANPDADMETVLRLVG